MKTCVSKSALKTQAAHSLRFWPYLRHAEEGRWDWSASEGPSLPPTTETTVPVMSEESKCSVIFKNRHWVNVVVQQFKLLCVMPAAHNQGPVWVPSSFLLTFLGKQWKMVQILGAQPHVGDLAGVSSLLYCSLLGSELTKGRLLPVPLSPYHSAFQTNK